MALHIYNVIGPIISLTHYMYVVAIRLLIYAEQLKLLLDLAFIFQTFPGGL